MMMAVSTVKSHFSCQYSPFKLEHLHSSPSQSLNTLCLICSFVSQA